MSGWRRCSCCCCLIAVIGITAAGHVRDRPDQHQDRSGDDADPHRDGRDHRRHARRHRPVGRRHAQPRDGDLRRRAAIPACSSPGCGSASFWRSARRSASLNGVLISVIGKLQPFVVTLATWSIIEGCRADRACRRKAAASPRAGSTAIYSMPVRHLGVPLLLLGVLIVGLGMVQPHADLQRAPRGRLERAQRLPQPRLAARRPTPGPMGFPGFSRRLPASISRRRPAPDQPTVGTPVRAAGHRRGGDRRHQPAGWARLADRHRSSARSS